MAVAYFRGVSVGYMIMAPSTGAGLMPTVSVIMNAHNSEKYVRESIQSVVDQTWINWEIILWDNASNDGTQGVVESFADPRMKYFNIPQKVSLYQSRMNAVRAAQGELIAFLDCDDLWADNKLELQIAVFDDPSCVASCTDYLVFDERTDASDRAELNRFRTYSTPVTEAMTLIRDYRVGMSTLVVRRRVALSNWEENPPDYSMIEDYDMLVRIIAAGPLVPIQEPLMRYRIHDNNFSWKNGTAILEWKRWQENVSSLPLEPRLQDEVRLCIMRRVADLEAREALRIGCGSDARSAVRQMAPSWKRLKYWSVSWLPMKLIMKLAS